MMKNLKEEIQAAVNIYKMGNFVKAEKITRELIVANPKTVFLYNLLGIILAAQDKLDEAIDIYNKGIEVDPKFGIIYNNLGLIFFNRKSLYTGADSNIKKAEEYYKKSIEIDKKNPEPFTNLGSLYNFINKMEESIHFHKKAISANPKFFIAYLNLANVYVGIGKLTEAKKYLYEAIEINKSFVQAHRMLSRIKKYTEEDSHIHQMIDLYNKTNDENSSNKVDLGFALGKAYEDINQFEKSFLFYKEANSLFRKKINFSVEKESEKFKEIKKTFNSNFLKKFNSTGYANSNPIFIVGMPRSGTTLIEQILSSHSKVFGGDEVDFIPELVRKYFGEDKIYLFLQGVYEFKIEELKKMGEEYTIKMKKIANELPRTTDKLPINFQSIGLIKLILPNSKIIHCYRDSKDNIFSIFKNHFPGGKVNFGYDLNEVVKYYNIYEDLMKYWNDLLPNFILNIKYENVITNTKEEIKKLLNFCNLEWESSCLEYYNNQRPIKTASDIQVRKKIYKTSINSWKNYENHLSEFYKKLNN